MAPVCAGLISAPLTAGVFLRVAGDSGGSTHDGGAVEKQASLDTNLYLYQVRPFSSHPHGFTTALANESAGGVKPLRN
jgi:hypothetical protein